MARMKFTAVLQKDGRTSGHGIELPFNPKEVYGKIRVPVIVSLKRHSYRTTIASQGGKYWIPVSKANREAAGVDAGDQLVVTLKPDTESRVVYLPNDFERTLKQEKDAWRAWSKLSNTKMREYVESIEGAKRPETRTRRIARTIEELLKK